MMGQVDFGGQQKTEKRKGISYKYLCINIYEEPEI